VREALGVCRNFRKRYTFNNNSNNNSKVLGWRWDSKEYNRVRERDTTKKGVTVKERDATKKGGTIKERKTKKHESQTQPNKEEIQSKKKQTKLTGFLKQKKK